MYAVLDDPRNGMRESNALSKSSDTFFEKKTISAAHDIKLMVTIDMVNETLIHLFHLFLYSSLGYMQNQAKTRRFDFNGIILQQSKSSLRSQN